MKSTPVPPSAATPVSGALADFDHDILDQAAWLTDEVSCSAVKLLFHVAGLESCARGVCCAKARTLAARMGCSDRTVRRRMAELAEHGLVEKVRRRCRTAWRGLTLLGKAVLAVIQAGGPLAVSAQVSAQVSAHKGEAQQSENNSPRDACRLRVAASPPEPVDPRQYRLPRVAARLSEAAWASVASWMSTARSVSWARCRMAHRGFYGLVRAIHASREWPAFNRGQCARGRPVCAEDLVRLAIEDAHRRGKDFGTIETAMAYVSRVVLACVRERRLPGEGLAEVCRRT